MGMITLKNASPQEATFLPNIFIDDYMPEANGEFVKVYIYLLRTMSSSPVSFSLEEMADCLLCTERDILRGLKYWARQGLLALELTDSRELVSVTVLLPRPKTAGGETPAASGRTEGQRNGSSAAALTPSRVSELKQNEEIVQLLYIAEQYLGKTLTASEVQKILFFYDGLGFSADLIEYLIEYCVSRNHRSIRYIETVAMAWAKEGISSVADAKKANARYKRDYYTILKAMGITNRSPVESEITLMDTWLKTYGFSLEIIQAACTRTVLQTGQASFQYTDKILEGWKKKKVHDLSDIQALDAEHQKQRKEKKSSRPISSAPNRFNNFQQREYDFDEYEKRLLKH